MKVNYTLRLTASLCLTILCHAFVPDITLLIEKLDDCRYNLTCVATDDETLKSALTWIPNDLNQSIGVGPTPVRELEVYSKNTTSIQIRWRIPHPPQGIIENFLIKCCTNEFCTNNTNIYTCKLWSKYKCGECIGVLEHVSYNITVSAKHEEIDERGLDVQVVTKAEEEISAEPMDFKMINQTEDDFLLQWTHPNISNGPLKYFAINASVIDTMNDSECHTMNYTYPISEEMATYAHNISELCPSTTYYLTIQAVNSFMGNVSNGIQIVVPPKTPTISEKFKLVCKENSCTLKIPVINHINSKSKLLIKILTKTNMSHSNARYINPRREYETFIISNSSIDFTNFTNILNANIEDIKLVVVNRYKDIEISSKASIIMEDVTETASTNYVYVFLTVTFLTVTVLIIIVMLYQYRKIFPNEVSEQFHSSHEIQLEERSRLLPDGNVNKLIVNKVNLKAILKECANTNDTENIFEFDFANIKNESKFPKQKQNYLSVQNDKKKLNANFIQGWKGERTYIASKCPSINTKSDFWLMIWNESVSIIISLSGDTCPKEEIGIYWSDDIFHDESTNIKIELQSTETYTDYIVRNFVVSKLGVVRQVKQFNFISWSNYDIPTFPLSFFNFLKIIANIDIDNCSIVVHCSDGIVRTCIFILCYNFLHNEDEIVDVYKYFKQIRNCRPFAIRQIIQYKFIYFILDEIINGINTSVAVNTFLWKVQELYTKNKDIHFKYIIERQYIYKILYSQLITSYDLADVSVIYGYQDEYKMFCTKYQPIELFSDIWQLVFTQQIGVIIVLQDIDEVRQKFWPETDKPFVYHNLKIHMINCSTQENVKIYKLTISALNKNTIHATLLYFNYWKISQNVPLSVETFYKLYRCYNLVKQPDSNVLLNCYDGFTASGLFATFNLLIQKLKFDKLFDLCWAVLSIKYHNQNFMDKIEQHKFLYSLTKFHLECIENDISDHQYEIVNEHSISTYDILANINS